MKEVYKNDTIQYLTGKIQIYSFLFIHIRVYYFMKVLQK